MSKVRWRRLAGRGARVLVTPPLTLLTLVRVALALVRNRSLFAEADRIFISRAGGFGHTVIAPDMLRRRYPGARCLAVFLEDTYHNTFTHLLWRDINVLFLPCRVRIRFAGRRFDWSAPNRLRKWIVYSLGVYLRRRGPGRLAAELYNEVAARHPVAHRLPWFENAGDPGALRWTPGWATLLRTVAASPIRLPDHVEQELTARIREFVGGKEWTSRTGICTLYLRDKGGDGPSSLRSGSSLEAYLPALRYLVQAGWVVLLTGDVLPDARIRQEFGRRLVAAQFLPLREELFSLYAHTVPDFWIGNLGGPVALPAINCIPTLGLEAWPYGACSPHCVVLYKVVEDARGRPVPHNQVLSRHPYEAPDEAWRVRGNTPEEILAALRELIEPQTTMWQSALSATRSLPDHAVVKHAGCLVSPAWFRLFGDEDFGKAAVGSVAPCCEVGDEGVLPYWMVALTKPSGTTKAPDARQRIIGVAQEGTR